MKLGALLKFACGGNYTTPRVIKHIPELIVRNSESDDILIKPIYKTSMLQQRRQIEFGDHPFDELFLWNKRRLPVEEGVGFARHQMPVYSPFYRIINVFDDNWKRFDVGNAYGDQRDLEFVRRVQPYTALVWRDFGSGGRQAWQLGACSGKGDTMDRDHGYSATMPGGPSESFSGRSMLEHRRVYTERVSGIHGKPSGRYDDFNGLGKGASGCFHMRIFEYTHHPRTKSAIEEMKLFQTMRTLCSVETEPFVVTLE